MEKIKPVFPLTPGVEKAIRRFWRVVRRNSMVLLWPSREAAEAVQGQLFRFAGTAILIPRDSGEYGICLAEGRDAAPLTLGLLERLERAERPLHLRIRGNAVLLEPD